MDLSTLERLVLAQAVFEHGADAWQSVADLLSKHPALARPFSPQSCRQFYLCLMNDAELECSDANNSPRGKPQPSPSVSVSSLTLAPAPAHLTLAQRHYVARLLHLRDLIAAEEAKFKSIAAEIDQIRSGAWDDKIKARITSNGTDAADAQTPAQAASEPQQATAYDLVSTDDQTPSKQTPEREDVDAHPVDGTTEQLPSKMPPETPVDDDDHIATTPPVAEVVAPEPTPAEITQIATDDLELEAADTSEETKQAPEAAQMDVEETAAPQEPECNASGKPQQREGKRKVPDLDNPDENPREKKRPRDGSISTDLEDLARQRSTVSGEPASHHQTPPSIPNKRFQTVIGMLHSQISQHRNGNIFHNPIKPAEAPDYHDIIKRPMDLKTIKARIKDGMISNSLEFQRDVYLMFANAMMYNRPSSDIYRMAEEMMAESEGHINTFRQTEGFIRSTRS